MWQLFAMSTTLALWVVLFVVPVMTIITAWFRTESDHGYLAVRDWIAGLMADLQENLSGTRVVAASNRQPYNRVKHANIVGEYRKANLYTGHIAGVYGPGSQLVGVLAQGARGAHRRQHGARRQLSIGVYGAFLLYLVRLFAPIQQLAQLYNTYQQGNAAIDQAARALRHVPVGAGEARRARSCRRSRARITLEDVTFGYSPDALVLEHVDLADRGGRDVRAGRPHRRREVHHRQAPHPLLRPARRARCSSTGTTSPTSPCTRLRRQLGIVPQESFLFAGSIGDNIQFARPEATRDDVLAACEAVGILELIESLPERARHARATSAASRCRRASASSSPSPARSSPRRAC